MRGLLKTTLFLLLPALLFGQTVKTVSGVTWTTGVKTINGATAAQIKTVSGVSTPVSFTGIIDAIGSAPGIAFGVRRMSSTYTGPLIRIKRLSDGTESDINYSGEDIDNASISSFCSGTTCYVGKAYDQSGNGFDALGKDYGVNTTSLPIIYESGAITALNGKTAIKITHPRMFQWTSTGADLVDFVTPGAGTAKKTTGHMVGQQGSAPASPYKIILEDNADQSEVLWFYESSSAERIDFIETSASMGAVFTDAAQKQWTWQVDGNTFAAYQNGSSIGSGSNSSTQASTNTGVIFNIGGLSFSSRNMEGFIQEVAIWKTAVSVSTLFSNSDTYYSIP